jgi:serine/threonine-protein kinase RsbW
MNESIKIASQKHNICNAEYFVNDIFNKLKFSRKIYCKIYLSITEAVINAIIHGNKNDESKYIDLSFLETSKDFKFIVKDQGKGFNYNNLPDPRHPDNIAKESGRGIFIMKQYADKVIFEDKGSTVILIFNK